MIKQMTNNPLCPPQMFDNQEKQRSNLGCQGNQLLLQCGSKQKIGDYHESNFNALPDDNIAQNCHALSQVHPQWDNKGLSVNFQMPSANRCHPVGNDGQKSSSWLLILNREAAPKCITLQSIWCHE